MFEYLKGHFKHWLVSVVILTIVQGVAALYIYYTYIKGADDITVGLFLGAAVLIIVFITSLVTTVIEFAALAALALDKINDMR